MAVTKPVRSHANALDPALIPLANHLGKPAIALDRPVYVIGSRHNARINLISSSVSKAHALLLRSSSGVYIRDLASRTKVIVNGTDLREADLVNGDELKIGRFTFRFRAPATMGEPVAPAPAASLVVSGQTIPVPIDQRVLLIGRRSVCDLHLLEESVSTAHAVIFEIDGQRFIRDLGSRTGTFVNGVSTHQHQLAAGDRVRIGETDLNYVVGAGSAPLADAVTLDELLSPAPAIELPPPSEALGGFDVETLLPPAQESEKPNVELEPIGAGNSADVDVSQTLPPPSEMLEELSVELEPIEADDSAARTLPPPTEPVEKIESASVELEPIEADESTEQTLPRPTEAVEEIESSSLELEPIEDLSPPPELEIALEPFAEATEKVVAAPPSPLEKSVQAVPEQKADAFDLTAPPIDAPEVESEPIDEQMSAPAELTLEALPLEKIEPNPSPAAPDVEQIEDEAEPAWPVNVPDAPLPLVLTAELASEVSPDDIVEPSEKELEQLTHAPAVETIEPPVAASTAPMPDFEAEVLPPTPPIELPDTVAATEPAAEASLPTLEKPEEPKVDETFAADTDLPTPTSEAEAYARSVEAALKKSRGRKPKAKKPPTPPKKRGRPPKAQVAPAETVAELVTDTKVSEELAASPLDFAPPANNPEPVAQQSAPLDQLPPDVLPDAAPDTLVTDLDLIDLAPPPDVEPALELEKAEKLAAPIVDLSPVEVESVTKPIVAEDDIAAASASPATPPDSADTSAEASSTLDELDTPRGEDVAAIAESASEKDADDLALEALLSLDETPATPVIDEAVVVEGSDDVAAVSGETVAELSQLDAELSDTVDAPPDTAAPVQAPLNGHSVTLPSSRAKWVANHDNVLGGQPLDLPPANPVTMSEQPLADVEPSMDDDQTVNGIASGGLSDNPNGSHDMLPPRPRGLARYRSERDLGFGDESQNAADSSSPSALTSSFEALANSPLREMDVFSTMSPPAEEPTTNQDDEDEAAEAAEAGIGGRLPRGTITGVFDETPEPAAHRHKVVPNLLPVSATPSTPMRGHLTDAEIKAVRRRYLRRVSALVGTMVVLIIVCGALIYNLMGVSTSVDASMRYKNLGSLKQIDRVDFEASQLRLLKEDNTRRQARRTLQERNPETPAEFLDDQIDYVKTIDHASFSQSDQELLLIHLDGHDAPADASRASAIAQALYMQDSSLLEDGRHEREGLDALKRSIDDTQQQLASLTDSISKLRILGENSPSLDQVTTLESQANKAEAAWTAAVAAMKAADAELTRMKSVPADDSAQAPTTAPNIAEDTKLKELQTQLVELNSKIKANRAAGADAAATARKALDDKLAGFQKDVANAQGMAGDNPEIAAYIEAAQRLQETTKQLTDALIHRQEQQYRRLSELKDQLNEKLETRRVEMWQSDKELADSTEQLAIQTRKYNAAIGSGLQKDADEAKSAMELAKTMIKARQDMLPGDAFYSDVIQKLTVIIDSTKKDMEDDRAATERQMADLQKSFTSNQTVERLPEEQKQLAAALTQRLTEINSARQQYNQAADAAVSDADNEMKSQVATVQASLEARQKELADKNVQLLRGQQEQQRVAAIEAKQSELARLTADEDGLRKLFFDKQRELREARVGMDAGRENSNKLDALIRQKGALQADLEAKIAQVDLKQRQVTAVIDPQKPSDGDVVVRRGEDRRLLYTVSSGGVLLAIFSGLILWTLHTASILAHHAPLHATDLRPVTPPQSLPFPAADAPAVQAIVEEVKGDPAEPNADLHEPAGTT